MADLTDRRLPEGVRATLLDNGVQVVTEAMPDVRSVSVGFWVRIGSRDEGAGVEGASHFLEHLLFKGTRRRSALEIAQVMDEVGGDMNAFTSKEYTCFYARCLDRDLDRAVDVLGDMLTDSTILAHEVDNERDVVLEEIRMHLDTPDDLVHSDFSQAYYGPHPLGREILGSFESITGMSRDAVHDYWRAHYTSGTLTVAVAGNLDHDAVVARARDALGGLPPGAAPPERAPAPDEPVQRRIVRTRPTEQAHVVLGGRGLARGHELRFAQSVLNQAVGGGMASRLFQEIREKRGLAYSVYSYPAQHTDTGTFAVYAGTTPAKVGEVIGVMREELEAVRTKGLTDEEFSRAKRNLAGSVVLSLEDTSSRMSRIGKALATDGPLLGLDDVLAEIEAVTPEQVEAVADELLSGPFTLAVVGPLEDDEVPEDV